MGLPCSSAAPITVHILISITTLWCRAIILQMRKLRLKKFEYFTQDHMVSKEKGIWTLVVWLHYVVLVGYGQIKSYFIRKTYRNYWWITCGIKEKVRDQEWLSSLAFTTKYEAKPDSSERYKSCRRGNLEKWICSHHLVLPVEMPIEHLNHDVQ